MSIFLLSALAICTSVAIPLVTLCVELLASQIPVRRDPNEEGLTEVTPASTVVLIPAHNEEENLAETIRSVVPQVASARDVVVVADNCTDSTADVVRAEGATVVCRDDSERRGKGYALDRGIRYIAEHYPSESIVIVIDADCTAHPGTIANLASEVARTGRPAQALYRLTYPGPTNAKQALTEWALVVKNFVRPLGLKHLGGASPLTGSGMAFPLQTLLSSDLASGHIVEDMKLGVELAARGQGPTFCPNAVISSEFPTDGAARGTQRTRWEHGHLSLIGSHGPKIIRETFWRGRIAMLPILLDLAIPPLTLLGALWLVSLVVGAVAAPTSAVPLAISLIAGASAGFAMLIAWFRDGRDVISLWQMASIPGFAFRKAGTYFAFLFNRQRQWVRTARS